MKHIGNGGYSMDRTEAMNLLKQYNQEPFHIQHAITVEAVMGYFAEKLGYGEEKEFWKTVGLLHDLDFEQYPEQHCVKEMEIMTDLGLDPRLIHGVGSHGYGICCDVKPEHEMEKVLFATDELTGLIGAVIKMRPSKSTKDLELSSLKKKFKDKKFAAGCSRQVIRDGADMLGWELDTLMTETIAAMREAEDAVIAEVDAL
jgi:putative nucleotidyltransferase with HDIG domain